MKELDLSDQEYREVFEKAARLCVDLIFTCGDGVLLTKRAIPPFEGLWHLPGGRVIKGERIEEAVKRITECELGIKFGQEYNPRLIGFIEVIHDGEFTHSVSLAFNFNLPAGNVTTDSQSSEWKVFNTLPQEIHPFHAEFLRNNWRKITQDKN